MLYFLNWYSADLLDSGLGPAEFGPADFPDPAELYSESADSSVTIASVSGQ